MFTFLVVTLPRWIDFLLDKTEYMSTEWIQEKRREKNESI